MKDLASAESLEAARFAASPPQQERFVNDVVVRRHTRLELHARPWMTSLAGGLLSAAFAAVSALRGDAPGAMAATGAAATHLAFGMLAVSGQRARSKEGADPEAGCYRDDDDKLRLVLQDGERVIVQKNADGPVRSGARLIGGFFQSLWGLLLGGLPLALAAGRSDVVGLKVGLVTAGTFVGTWVFGRGISHLIASKPVERFVLTNRRFAALVAPGVAHVVPLISLPLRPVVVAREDGRATLALGQRVQPGARPLPAVGLLGWHDVDEQDAQRWARETMDARRLRLAERDSEA